MKQRIFKHGLLSFTTFEQGSGPTVLFLHGFPDHARSFRFQISAVSDAGYHCIAPTMRGYEPSSQPKDGDYRISSIASDVIAFIEQLDSGPVHLVGHDWGAVVSYLVAAMAPEKLLSLTTVAIPHPGRLRHEVLRKRPSQLLKSWYMIFFQLRGFADYVVEQRNWAFLEMLWRDWSPGWNLPESELRALKATFKQPGVKKAALGYYRALFGTLVGRDALRTRELFDSKIQVPTLALTGALDGCMDTRLHDDVMNRSDFPRGLSIERIQGAGHFVHQEKPEEINRLILRHLNANSQHSNVQSNSIT